MGVEVQERQARASRRQGLHRRPGDGVVAAQDQGHRPGAEGQHQAQGPLGDRVSALEIGRLGVERGYGRESVGQVVEDQDEVGLLEGGHRDADRVLRR